MLLLTDWTKHQYSLLLLSIFLLACMSICTIMEAMTSMNKDVNWCLNDLEMPISKTSNDNHKSTFTAQVAMLA